MHTHPRSDLAFGEQFFYGKPFGDISEEMKNCKAYHGAWHPFNPKGNLFRSEVVSQTETQFSGGCPHTNAGYPNFESWPAACSVLHQQMWVDWIERAHEGGLNIMVALATHNHCIADIAETSGAQDDRTVMIQLLDGIKDLVNAADFMEIAYSPEEMRKIVLNGKLAVVLGIEMDNIGNFYAPAEPGNAVYNPDPTASDIKAELDSIWEMGVRYIFPVHLTDNIFGGTAISLSSFSVPNKYNTGHEFQPEQVSTAETQIGFDLKHPKTESDPEADPMAKIAFTLVGGIMPKEINPSREENYTFFQAEPGMGHRNALGITSKGRFAIHYMMQKGFMIDVDHMSEKMLEEVLKIGLHQNYPLNSGHSGLREPEGTERSLTALQYKKLHRTGGMAAVGHGMLASNFAEEFRKVAPLTGFRNIAIGTDVNGFFPLPMADTSVFLVYDESLPKCTAGNRTWDINSDGFAHYGLFPDFLRTCQLAGMKPREWDALMSSAEDFALMWEKCERRKTFVKTP